MSHDDTTRLGYLTNPTHGVTANVDGSTTPQSFDLVCPAFTWIFISQFTVFIQDDVDFTNLGYGGLTALTNGIEVWLRTNGASEPDINITNQIPIKHTVDWALLCDRAVDDPVSSATLNQHNTATYKWDIQLTTGHDLRLLPGYSFEVTINDDLSGLTAHYFNLQGHLEDK